TRRWPTARRTCVAGKARDERPADRRGDGRRRGARAWPGRRAMSCPRIAELLAGGAAAEHARGCDDCRGVLEGVAARAPAGCGLAEALMAAQATGQIAPESERLLALHLGNCASCALVAGSLDAPAMADALASAVELERSFDDERPTPESRARHERATPESRARHER